MNPNLSGCHADDRRQYLLLVQRLLRKVFRARLRFEENFQDAVEELFQVLRLITTRLVQYQIPREGTAPAPRPAGRRLLVLRERGKPAHG